MATPTPTTTGLLLDDEGDSLVPIARAAPEHPSAAPAPATHAATTALAHPADADHQLLRSAIEWASSPQPTIGFRALVLYVTGVNLGISRRERELRLQFCALYRAAWSAPPRSER